MESFRYKPLNTAVEHPIRLLVLQPNKEVTGDIDCQLFHTALGGDAEKSSSYEALSYTWGDNGDGESIQIVYKDDQNPKSVSEQDSGRDCHQTDSQEFSVTKNLHAALRQLRMKDKSRLLWIDAICINQTDNEEKKNQIEQMRKIYLSAKRVVVWLGEEKDAKLALDFCDTIKRNENGDIPYLKEDQAKFNACYKLFYDPSERPWWSRSWILQEVLHAGDVMVYIGKIQISMEDLLAKFEKYNRLVTVISTQDAAQRSKSTTKAEESKSLKIELWFRAAAVAEVIPDVIQSTRAKYRSDIQMELPRLGYTLWRFRDQQATDGRDKIYAFLGIAKKEYGIEADYKVEKRELYTSLARQLLQNILLALVWVESPDREVAPEMELPTWVPDFSQQQHIIPRIIHAAYPKFDANQGFPKTTFEIDTMPLDPNILLLIGIRVGVVTKISTTHVTADPALKEFDQVKLIQYDRDPNMSQLSVIDSQEQGEKIGKSSMTFDNTSWGPCKSALGDIIIVAEKCKIPLLLRECKGRYLFVGCCLLIDSEIQDFTNFQNGRDPGFSPIMFGSVVQEVGKECSIEEFPLC